MSELESVIEDRLIKQLCNGESQWVYRPDIRNEAQLWANFKHHLEQNNKAQLNDQPLTELEFEKIKNDISHSSFFEAGKWLVGENGRVYVHIQRGNEPLHLLVLNNEQIAGGTSCYEVINQYQAFKTDEDELDTRNRRFDVTLLINGVPLIHIELKNQDHPYKDGFNQIKKYIDEGKFHGLFSNVQMFVISNVVDTRYFSAARASELKPEFLNNWVDIHNEPVGNYIDFAKAVLKVPMAHEMVARYTILDNESKRLILLRPYQIHAIEAMRKASIEGKSGFIWHTTGSGKTMTSYKATRNLLMDIPSLNLTVFLIDRHDLDQQTSTAFKSYATNDTIDVDNTDYTESLVKKLKEGKRNMIVTTRQKLQTMFKRRVKEGTADYKKITGLRIAFVVDECHRAISPKTQRELKQRFPNSLWYGFTGTPLTLKNPYPQEGDLPRTTEDMYGKCLHYYTIKEAIHDHAVLGFMIETFGEKGLTPEQAEKLEGSESHMRNVLDVILNKSATKLGLNLGRGQTFEGLLTVSSIAIAQKYYSLLKKIKNGEDQLKIDEKILKALPDFPKFAITYSIAEDKDESQENKDLVNKPKQDPEAIRINQKLMAESLADYNAMFGTSYKLDNIQAYNSNLNDRLARKKSIFNDRSQQLDLVIVVDRLLTGFDAPCLSTLFVDRAPMKPQHLIQAFSRTNRLFNKYKKFGQIVTFQYPEQFKPAIDEALKIYSNYESGVEGRDLDAIFKEYEVTFKDFEIALNALRGLVATPNDVAGLSPNQKKTFLNLFRELDKSYAQLKAFSAFNPEQLAKYPFSEEEYVNWAAQYMNVYEELKPGPEPGLDPDQSTNPSTEEYELEAVAKITVDYEYIVNLLRGLIQMLEENVDGTEKEMKLKEIQSVIDDYAKDNEKLAAMLHTILNNIMDDPENYKGKDIGEIINHMRFEAIDTAIRKFSDRWFVPFNDVRYEAFHFRNGELANENKLKDLADYAAYAQATENALAKFKFRKIMIEEFKNELMPEIKPLFI